MSNASAPQAFKARLRFSRVEAADVEMNLSFLCTPDFDTAAKAACRRPVSRICDNWAIHLDARTLLAAIYPQNSLAQDYLVSLLRNYKIYGRRGMIECLEELQRTQSDSIVETSCTMMMTSMDRDAIVISGESVWVAFDKFPYSGLLRAIGPDIDAGICCDFLGSGIFLLRHKLRTMVELPNADISPYAARSARRAVKLTISKPKKSGKK